MRDDGTGERSEVGAGPLTGWRAVRSCEAGTGASNDRVALGARCGGSGDCGVGACSYLFVWVDVEEGRFWCAGN